jgi:uncharacterized protein YbjT (DUF2867 family)
MSKSRRILVTGATGQQGGSVARHLIAAGHHVRALTRNPDSDAAKALASKGAEIVRGSFTDRASLKAALKGVDGAFLMGTSFEEGTEAESEQGIAFVAAAKKAGIGHLVYTSVSDADRKTGIPHFESKYEVEKHVVASGLPYTIMAPVFFFENHFAPFMVPGLQGGAYAVAMPADAKLQMISVDNIGQFGALVFAHPERFAGKRINIAGDEMTGTQYAEALSAASGKQIHYVEVPIDQVRQMSEDMALMYEWFTRVGYSADIAGLRRANPEVSWQRFSDWAGAQDWSVLDATPAAAR